MKRFLVIIACTLFCTIGVAQNRWTIQPDGKTIRMDATTTQLPHSDHIEMSGKRVSVVLRYEWKTESSSSTKAWYGLYSVLFLTIPTPA